MRKRTFFLLFFLGLSVTLLAQTDPTGQMIARGTTLPATCETGSLYVKINAGANGKLYVCRTTDTWEQQGIAGGGYATIDNEDTPLTQRTTLNFAGAGVNCADDTDQTTCTIAGGGSTTFDLVGAGTNANALVVGTGGTLGVSGSGTIAATTATLATTATTANAGDSATAFFSSGLLESIIGGTGNGFTLFSGPATTEKTFTLPNASTTILTTNAAITAPQGGTGQSTTATLGRFLKGDGTNWGTSTGSASGIGTPTACTNQFVTSLTLNSDAAPTSSCTTATLASAQFANQGTTTTVLHGNAAGNPAFGAVVGGDMTAGTVTSTQLATANKTITKTINIFDPTTGDTNLVQIYWPAAVTLVRVACSIDTGTSVTIQFDERAEATPNTAGTDSLTSALVCDTDSQVTTSFSDAGIAIDVPHNLQITGVVGTPGVVRIHVKATVN